MLPESLLPFTIWLFLAVAVAVLLVIRAFWLWYWKVDKIIILLEQIEQNTRPKEILRGDKFDNRGRS